MVRAIGRVRRRAFTLIEMLVVVAIITVLLGILLPAIQLVKIRAQVAQARNDISQLSTGIEAFKSAYNVPFVPSHFSLQTQYDMTQSLEVAYLGYLKRVWPRLKNQSNNPQSFQTSLPNQVLNTGNGCLVFFLGGYLSGTTNSGFSASEADPFSSSGGSARKGPFFEFPPGKLQSTGQAIGQFIDPWGNPYVYFTSMNGGDYATMYVPPMGSSSFDQSPAYPATPTNYNTLNASNCLNFIPGDPSVYGSFASPIDAFRTNSSAPLQFYNANSYQIISAGPNKRIGPGGMFQPAQGYYSGGEFNKNNTTAISSAQALGVDPTKFGGDDDLANFYPKALGAP